MHLFVNEIESEIYIYLHKIDQFSEKKFFYMTVIFVPQLSDV